MHPAARSGFLYLLASAWQTDDCTISSDPIDLATESGLGDELWAVYGTRILRKFVPVGDRFQNPVQVEEWNSAKRTFEKNHGPKLSPDELSEVKRMAGIAGAKKRWQKDGKGVSGTWQTNSTEMAKDSLQMTGTGTTTDKEETNKSITIAPLSAVAKVHPDLEIYNAYPRKEGKGAAMTKINRAVARLVKGEAPHESMTKLEAQRYLMRRVLEYARSPAGSQPDKSKIPHPSTWFHQKRYDDDQSNWHRMEMRNGRQHSKTGGNITAGAQALAYFEQAERNSESAAEVQHEEGIGGDSGDLRHLRAGSIDLRAQ